MTIISPYINIHTHNKCENELSITTVGIHPYAAESGAKLQLQEVTSDIDAIGEIGLDFARNIDRKAQEELFEQQLSIAQQLSLPVVIHSVRAVDRTMEILKGYTLKAVIFHGFIGSSQQAQNAIKCGYYLSFGHRCFESPKTLIALSNSQLTNIFLETDEHEISIEEIYSMAAAQREESLTEIKDQIYKNYIKLFNKR
ncbi:MAG: TatD family hydrolase [Rikenellaceae bacterium]